MRLPLLLALLALAAPAAVDAAPLWLGYEARWAGLPAGDVELRLDEADGAFRAEIDIRTEGLPRWFTRFRGRGVATGTLGPAGLAAPGAYDAWYDLRSRRDKRVSLRFHPAADGVVAERGPEDGSAESNPELPRASRLDVVDPLTTVGILREALRGGLAARLAAGEGFRLQVYDGKRRFDVVGRGAVREVWAGRRVLRLDLMLVPIDGFERKSDEPNPDKTPRPLAVTFGDDAELAPLRLETTIGWFPVVVEATRRCGGAATRCRLGG